MSHTIIIDESNGNGIVNILPQTTSTGTGDSVNGVKTSTVLVTSISNEDLSQSCSEYTDADESMSAPTEFLAEFLSAVMLRNYKKALKYCKLILQFEPNNLTAKEFYPLIEEKVKQLDEATSSESDENYNNTSSGAAAGDLGDIEMGLGATGVTTAAADDDGGAYGVSTNRNKNSLKKTNMFRNHHNNEEDQSSSSSSSSSSDDEDSSNCDSDEKELNDGSNSNTSNSTSASDNTTHSYSSLLLEDEDEASPTANNICNITLPFNICDLGFDDNQHQHHQPQAQLQPIQQTVPNNIVLNKNDLSTNELAKLKDAFNGNGNYVTTSCSDSESPTEPLTQKIAAILRSKCLPPPARDDT